MMLKYLFAAVVALTFALSVPAFADEAPAPVTAEASVDCGALSDGATTSRSCQRCGDGFCAKSCGETAENCPEDCGGVEM